MSSDINLPTSETSPSSATSSTVSSVDGTSDQIVETNPTSPASVGEIEPISEPVPPASPAPASAPDPAEPANLDVATTELVPDAPIPSKPPEPAAPVSPAVDSVIAERITILGDTSSDDTTANSGGEWDLLTSKIREWFEANDIGEQINQARQPLRLVAYAIGFLLVLKVYSGLLSAIGTIPLAPRLLELVGLCSVISFSATRLVRTADRREVIEGLRQRWTAFSGGKG